MRTFSGIDGQGNGGGSRYSRKSTDTGFVNLLQTTTRGDLVFLQWYISGMDRGGRGVVQGQAAAPAQGRGSGGMNNHSCGKGGDKEEGGPTKKQQTHSV